MPDRPTDHVVISPAAANDEPIGPNDVTISFSTVATLHIPSGAKLPTGWEDLIEGGTLTLDAGDGPAVYEVFEVEVGDHGRWIRAIANRPAGQ